MGIVFGFRDLERADFDRSNGDERLLYLLFIRLGILDDGILVVKLEQNKGLWNARKGRTKCGSVATNREDRRHIKT